MLFVVTGASGYIGGVLVRRLLEQGHGVRALLRRPVDGLLKSVDIRVLGDFLSADLPAALAGAACVVHLAGRAHVFCEHDAGREGAYRHANTELTEALARAAVSAEVSRFVYMSTVKVYGDSVAGPITEAIVPFPGDAYGRSKLDAERALIGVAQGTGMTVSVIRSPLVYGPYCTGNVRRLSKLVRLGVPLPLGAVENRRSMIAVSNLADILIRAGTDPRAANETFVVSDGPPISTPQMIAALAEGLGARTWQVPVPITLLRLVGRLTGRMAEFDRLCGSFEVDSRKLRTVLGWSPIVSTHDALVDAGRSFQ